MVNNKKKINKNKIKKKNKTKLNTNKKTKKIIENSMLALDISQDMKTDPVMMQKLLRDMEIEDFKTSFPPMNKFFREVKSKPLKLKPMLTNIKKGLILKHPAIIEFLELALKKNWLKKSEHVKRSVHITFLLESISSAMCNNHKFFIQAQNHYRNKTKKFGLDKKNISKTVVNAWSMFHDFFKVAKLLSIDPIMIYFRLQRGLGDLLFTEKQLKKLYKQNKINFFEYKLLFKLCNKCSEPANKLVRINIYEAGTTEYKNGFKTNAISAYVLAEDLKFNSPPAMFKPKKVIPEKNTDKFYNSIASKDNVFLDINANQDWVSLYITWNLAFILGNLDDLDVLFPKLLMPSIINATNNNFLGVRVISLWLSINNILFRNIKKIEVIGPKNKVQMAKAWARINKKYAFDLAKNKTNENSKIVMKGYKEFFKHPVYKIFKLGKAFFKKVCK